MSVSDVHSAKLGVGLLSVEQELQSWRDRFFGMFVVEATSSAEIMGTVGFGLLDEQYGRETHSAHLIAVMFPKWRARGDQGHTCATLACFAALAWWRSAHADAPVYAVVDSDNHKARTLVKGLGGEQIPVNALHFKILYTFAASTQSPCGSIAALAKDA